MFESICESLVNFGNRHPALAFALVSPFVLGALYVSWILLWAASL